MSSINDWRGRFERASFGPADEPQDRNGKTSYDYVVDDVQALRKNSATWRNARDAAVQLLLDQSDIKIYQWLRILGIVEELFPLPNRSVRNLVNLLLARRSLSADARAYLVRSLSSQDAAINWRHLTKSGIADELAETKPLIWADALAYAGHAEKAADVLCLHLEGGSVDPGHVLQLIDRWEDRLGEGKMGRVFRKLYDATRPESRQLFKSWATQTGHQDWLRVKIVDDHVRDIFRAALNDSDENLIAA